MRGYRVIRAAMRQAEVEVLAELRKDEESRWRTWHWHGSWRSALNRLVAGGMVRVSQRGICKLTYAKPRKGARPVTPALRRTRDGIR